MSKVVDPASNSPVLDNATGNLTVTYTVLATNTGSAAGTYDILEVIDPQPGITVVGQPTIVYAGGETEDTTAVSPFTPSTTEPGTLVVDDEGLIAGGSESWTVTLVYAVDQNTVDPLDLMCDPNDGLAGGGGLHIRSRGSTVF